MTPMAGRIPNADQNRFVFCFCTLQGFFAPRIPIDRVVGVLEEVRASFVDESI